MGKCLQVVHTFKQNITGTNPERSAAGTGDSLANPELPPGLGRLATRHVGRELGERLRVQVRSPDFHDNTRGIRVSRCSTRPSRAQTATRNFSFP
jgi:hypothetical protein